MSYSLTNASDVTLKLSEHDSCLHIIRVVRADGGVQFCARCHRMLSPEINGFTEALSIQLRPSITGCPHAEAVQLGNASRWYCDTCHRVLDSKPDTSAGHTAVVMHLNPTHLTTLKPSAAFVKDLDHAIRSWERVVRDDAIGFYKLEHDMFKRLKEGSNSALIIALEENNPAEPSVRRLILRFVSK